VHILEESLRCVEAGTKHGEVWDGEAYVTGTPIGGGVATSEPELGAEEGGQVGQITVAPLGVDSGDDTGPPDWIMSKHLDIKIWFDKNGDGDFDDEGELIVYDKLFDVACNLYDLGVVPPASASASRSEYEECKECKGGVTWLELRYNGEDTATIEVKSKKKKSAVLFSGTVNPYDTFKIFGAEKGGKLGTEIGIWVDGKLATKIHTSCSQPIGPGLIQGDFEVIAGESLKGGLLCPITGSGKNKDKNNNGGGWGSCFKCSIGSPQNMEMALMAGQNILVGTVSVWTDDGCLWVKFDTTMSNWEMKETHVYVGADPPSKMAPGKFPYKHNPVNPPTEDLYQIPLCWEEGEEVYIATHAEGTDGETAWSRGDGRKMKIELHLQQVEDPAWAAGGVDYDRDGDIDADDEQKKWWPTNVFQGDKCTFDMELNFKRDSNNPTLWSRYPDPKWWRQYPRWWER